MNWLFFLALALFAIACGLNIKNQILPANSQALGGSIDVPGYTAVGPTGGVSTGVLVKTSSTVVLATSTSRTFMTLVPSVAMYCNLDAGTNATLYNGIFVPTSTPLTLNFNEDSLYRGSIQCIASIQGTTTVYSH